MRWLASRVEEFGGIGRVVLLGDSAGGNLAAATSMCLRDAGGPRVDVQVLLYPCLAPARGSTFRSYAQQADGPVLTRAEMTWFWDHYLVAEADELDPRAAPLLAPDLSGLPPTTVVVCELDPLRDESLAYAERLQTAGVETDVICYPGAAHGFWWMDGVMRQAGELTAQLGPILRGDTRRNP